MEIILAHVPAEPSGAFDLLDPLLASVVVIAVVAFTLSSRGTSQRITAASRRTRRGEGDLANTAQESLASIKVVQAYGLESLVERRFTGANHKSLTEGVRSLRLAARLERGTDVIVGLATATVMVGGGAPDRNMTNCCRGRQIGRASCRERV